MQYTCFEKGAEGNMEHWSGDTERFTVYDPGGEHGFSAWVTTFDYPDGSVGISFDEVVEEKNTRPAPRVEFAEAAGVPVSYCTVECRNSLAETYRVYMRSWDGIHFSETGRCRRNEGNFCQIATEDEHLIGYDVPKRNGDGTGWADHIVISESRDGGSSWNILRFYLQGTAPYLWRVRRLKDGTVILLASLYGTPWGEGKERGTRNTMLPDETYTGKILTFFAASRDGIHFGQPCYILPGLGAHEYDFCELPDGRLLFIAGDVQATPVGRQFVTRGEDGFIPGPVFPIRRGAPEKPEASPQGGYVPETFCVDPEGEILYGFRRGKGLSASGDRGENWTRFSLPEETGFPYQPVMTSRGNDFFIYGHIGGDNAFGEQKMKIIGIRLHPGTENRIPVSAHLTLERCLSLDGSGYINAFRTVLTGRGKPLSGQKVIFRASSYWNDDGTPNIASPETPEYEYVCKTDENGCAGVELTCFDHRPDIHLAYYVSAVFDGNESFSACRGPERVELAMTPRRNCPYPYDAYYAENCLYLSPKLLNQFPEACGEILENAENPEGIHEKLREKLLECGVLIRTEDGKIRRAKSVHCGPVITAVKMMPGGDFYV